MKKLLFGLMTLVSLSSFAAGTEFNLDYLRETVDSVEQTYNLNCRNIVKDGKVVQKSNYSRGGICYPTGNCIDRVLYKCRDDAGKVQAKIHVKLVYDGGVSPSGIKEIKITY
jgi:hypothetical protein